MRSRLWARIRAYEHADWFSRWTRGFHHSKLAHSRPIASTTTSCEPLFQYRHRLQLVAFRRRPIKLFISSAGLLPAASSCNSKLRPRRADCLLDIRGFSSVPQLYSAMFVTALQPPANYQAPQPGCPAGAHVCFTSAGSLSAVYSRAGSETAPSR